MPTESGEVIQNELASFRQQVQHLNQVVFEKNKRIHELEDQVTRLLHPPPLDPTPEVAEPPVECKPVEHKKRKVHKK